MKLAIEAILSPPELAARREQGFAGQVCVVFDVLRATSVMVTALAHGAAGIRPVAEIAEALAEWERGPEVLLAGERAGLRITAAQTGSRDFDLGNSPREYVRERVAGKWIVSTTTNGTRALRSSGDAQAVLAAAFLNLRATAQWVRAHGIQRLVLIGAGTGPREAYEDTLAVGALITELRGLEVALKYDAAAAAAVAQYEAVAGDLPLALGASENGTRLRANPDLAADVAFCARRDVYDFAVIMMPDGLLRRAGH